MNSVDLISMLDRVRQTGQDKWIALCPAHEDKTASLSVARGRVGDRWVLHCFAGCLPIEVMNALGLELKDLFDDQQYRLRGDRVRPRVSAGERLELLEHETTVAYLIACEAAKDGTIAEANVARLGQAAARIGKARYER